jgi:hypothetical protein
MLTLKESLKHYTTVQLRKALSNYNKEVKISGYSKLERSDLENLIVLNASKFQHMILEKAPEEKKKVKKEVKKPMVKKEEKKEVKPMVKKEEKKEVKPIVKKDEKKDIKPIEKKEEPKEEEKKEDYNTLSQELTKLILFTELKNISKALVKLGYNGKIENNKISLNFKLLKTFNTVNKIKKLINELQSISRTD